MLPMQTTVLHPPNILALSEDVIGSVVQRTWPSRRSTVAGGIERPVRCAGFTRDATNAAAPSSTEHTHAPKPTLTPSNEEKQTTEGMDDQSTLKRLRKTDLVAYHRERRRRNQERYRRNQQKRTEELERGNQQLRSEIERLRSQRNSLSYGISTNETPWSVAVEYFRVFRRGLVVPSTGVPSGTRLVELDFMRATMAKDLDAGNVRGFELLARNWKVVTQYFKDVHIELGQLQQTAKRSLVATTITSITVTTHSLRYMFPHLAVDSLGRRKHSWIADKLLEQRLVMRGSVHFDWDDVGNRMVGLIIQVDMITPLLQLLGKLEDVSVVFRKARIQPDLNLVVGEHLDQHQLEAY